MKNFKNKTAAELDGITPKVWKTGKFNDLLLYYCNEVYNENVTQSWTEGCILPFPKKGSLGQTSNYSGIILTSIAAKIYNALLLNQIQPEMEKILRRNQNGFRSFIWLRSQREDRKKFFSLRKPKKLSEL